ncbi:zinc ribbon domain-containing protein [Haloarcula litorea]|uniref:zinc ribbon domain-containing protein n=1 Tax=Haloarcula litorea TaxID=3032579 RepID=UPI0023E80D95|nr:zinc ribbon domain-containing protein [Halomicroarcula sp. GDY20]
MVPTDDDRDATYVECPECGTRASPDWSFCRSCEASLADAEPAEEGVDVATPGLAAGCPKCGHDDAEVDEVAVTGSGPTRLLDIQNRQFRAVSCTNCGYTEFYKGTSPSAILDLFLG